MIELDYALIDGKFEFNCELSDVVVFVEDVSFNWSFILWSLFGIVVVNIFQNVTVDNDRVYYLIKEYLEILLKVLYNQFKKRLLLKPQLLHCG